MTADAPEVRAAGGIVTNDAGRILLVHRPRYDDWSFPKGKVDKGESLEECALREVEEETGFRCELGEPVAAIRYRDAKGRAKEVRYWHMSVLDGSFSPNDEVDEIRWVKPRKAADLLSYQHDVDVLHAATT